ncbi:aminotransferase class I/II-fold pyridoxal phosphate-dependent enzyme [Bifidobacterium vespertilionis]|uniref:aminotransferase class I/II-fold pyridoxal phosphate-dependent enzyme n=1 Tax=Bifidobacterium vespertilionis TaxID=2562524 RepID=UPI001BDC5F5D|nr:aminotransferase class I/II-fold pyridoxal phosphate-dependent enzyme [Bifidobacterium vespertilionis]MBT1179806.1 aminotransferase class I/II-fold pyridoxal phosphate-dependent enzyme [Bifidobacterium vespertilionis]
MTHTVTAYTESILVPESDDGRTVDLRIGSPVDTVSPLVRQALADGFDAHAYTTAKGLPQFRAAVVEWYSRIQHVDWLDDDSVIPVAGTKNFIALAALWLGLRAGDVIVQPKLHYPTYGKGAELIGATIVAEDDPSLWPMDTRLIWLNSPRNPDGAINDVAYLERAVAAARERHAVIIQDECYGAFDWSAPERRTPAPSILAVPSVVEGGRKGILACNSLSKQANMAGYRVGYLAGDRTLIDRFAALWAVHGQVTSVPIQLAAAAALSDGETVRRQYDRLLDRRHKLLAALHAWGLQTEERLEPNHPRGGYFIWGCVPGRDGDELLDELRRLRILGASGATYGDVTGRYIRLSITATDRDVNLACRRLEDHPLSL